MRHAATLLLFTLTAIALRAANDTAPFAPKSLAYVLQADHLAPTRADAIEKLRDSNRDLIVIDAAYNADRNGDWTPAEIAAIRSGKPARRVVAYLSIGEAETYRPYWQKNWTDKNTGTLTPAAPAWLDTENPEWKGNYRVRYWHAAWQKILLAALDKIIAKNFDGIYLDIVDGFEFYEYDLAKKDWIDNRPNPETGNTYRRDMIAWVTTIATHARTARPDFLIIPQNARQLLANAPYRDLISAIGLENVIVSGAKLRSEKQQRTTFAALAPFKATGKPIFIIDYPKNKTHHAEAFRIAATQNAILLLTDRQLTTLGESK